MRPISSVARHLIFTALSMGMAFMVIGGAQPQTSTPASRSAVARPLPGQPEFAPGVVLIGLKPGATPPIVASGRLTPLGRPAVAPSSPSQNAAARVYRLRLPAAADVPATVAALAHDPGVAFVEPDYIARGVNVPNDALYGSQWGLSQIGAAAAWDVVTGTASVVIAVVDSGIDLSHPDLAGQLWVNPGEIPGNGLDDDQDGYVDDVNGWNFTNNSNDLADDNGHGTLVAGVAGAAANNAIGVAGVCWNCRLMTVKAMQGGIANYSDIAAAVRYAADKGANVINLSLGGYADSTALRDAITYAASKNVVIVGGAGNDNVSTPFYPAAYPEALAVAATTAADDKTASSNFGDWVDLAAPGEAIPTTFLGGTWGSSSGTSLSAGFVSGLAGLLRSQHPAWSAALVKAQILHTAQALTAAGLGRGRLSAANAVTQAAHPGLAVVATTVNGDPLGRPAPGGGASLAVTLSNDWLDAATTTGTLTSSDGSVTIAAGAAAFGTIAAGNTASNSPVYSFTVAAGAGYNHPLPFTLSVTANSGAYQASFPITLTTRSSDQPVGGTIAADAVWTSDKTYLINSNVGVAPGVTLTIQPGTVIRFNGNYTLTVGGTLIADGAASQPIRFMSNIGGTWGGLVFNDSSADALTDVSGAYQGGDILRWVRIDNAANGIACSSATPYLAYLTLTGGGLNCTPGSTALFLRDSALTGDVSLGTGQVLTSTFAGNLTLGDGSTVQNSTITGGSLSLSSGSALTNTVKGGGLSAGNASLVSGNNIEGAAGWGLTTTGSVTVLNNRVVAGVNGLNLSAGLAQGNLIANNAGIGLQVSGGTVMSNTLTGNHGNALVIAAGTPVLQGNNLEFNLGPYDMVNNSANPITATLNWWGTTNPAVIAQRLFDFYDDIAAGPVQSAPSAVGPIQTAPAYVRGVTVLPDTTLGIQTGTFDVQFSRPMDTGHNSQSMLSTVLAWAPRASLPAGQLLLGVTAASNGKIYAMGGAISGGTIATVEEYDPATNVWRARASMPTSRSGVSVAAASNGKIYAIGGNNHGNLATVEEYDPATNLWRTRASMPTARAVGGAAVSNGKIYVIGGYGLNGYLATVEVYDPATDTWATRASMPTARGVLGVAAASNGKIYAIGGYNPGGDLATVEEYDPATDTWSTRASMPTARERLGVTAANNGKIYAIGGNYWQGNYYTTYYTVATVEEYDPATDTWATRASMPTARGALGVAAASNGKIYAIGGQDAATSLATVEEGTLPLEPSAFYNLQWPSTTVYQAQYDIASIVPKGIYTLTVSGAVGADGLEIAPNASYTFTVDYAGGVADVTAPLKPLVAALGDGTLTSLRAWWSSSDPESGIQLYRYAIGLEPGGREVVNWTYLTGTSVKRAGLNLVAGQVYYVTVEARNAGGLWSQDGVSNPLVGGLPPKLVFLPLMRH